MSSGGSGEEWNSSRMQSWLLEWREGLSQLAKLAVGWGFRRGEGIRENTPVGWNKTFSPGNCAAQHQSRTAGTLRSNKMD